MKLSRNVLAFAIGLAMLFPALAGTTGSVTGTLKDANGSPVAGVKLTITNKSVGLKTEATTDRKGAYGFLTLLPGTYDLHAEGKGFAAKDRSGVVVHVNSVIRIDLTLEPDSK
jgi:protocatechuate 3,4-dioxygenase beta subunit